MGMVTAGGTLFLNEVQKAQRELAQAQKAFGSRGARFLVLPFVHNGWMAVQNAFVFFAAENGNRQATLDVEFLASRSSISAKSFDALVTAYHHYLSTGCAEVKSGLLRRHIRAMSRSVDALWQLACAAKKTTRFPVHWFRGYRLVVSTFVAVVLIASAALVAKEVPGDDNGLTALYYKDSAFKRKHRIQIDKTIDFDWKNGRPMKGIGRDHFSVRWEGYVRIAEGEKKRFAVAADDSIWLFIDGKRIIANKGPHSFREKKSERIFGPGIYKIRVDYIEHTGAARARLSWNTENGYWSKVPAIRLRAKGRK
ncbi:MAG: hypothetical protein JXR76_14365 [Deltaproteobacteria bacterium]|nr:hypothetical protein [Deltaproteobacteria bacterium]